MVMLAFPNKHALVDTVPCELGRADSLFAFLFPRVRHLVLVMESRFLPYDLEFGVWWSSNSSFV